MEEEYTLISIDFTITSLDVEVKRQTNALLQLHCVHIDSRMDPTCYGYPRYAGLEDRKTAAVAMNAVKPSM
jgi:hypothetical protein